MIFLIVGFTLLNVAHTKFGGSCVASSQYNRRYNCTNAISDSSMDWAVQPSDTDRWIKVNFHETYHIVRAWVTPRQHGVDRIHDLKFMFSNGLSVSVSVYVCASNPNHY